jgi:hypothetical protein
MKTKLLVTYGIKRVEEDNYKNGCDPKTASEYDFECKPMVFESLEALAKHYGLPEDKDSWQVFDGRLMCQRLETEDGSEPTKAEMALFKQNKLRLWLADYDFHVHLIEEGDATETALAQFCGVQMG